jgi:hypothetical protein
LLVQTGQLENVFQEEGPQLQRFTNLLQFASSSPKPKLYREMLAPDNTTLINASSGVESGGDRHNFFSKLQCSGHLHTSSAVHRTPRQKYKVRLKLQLNFRITCNVATHETSNEGQASHAQYSFSS